jgi:hypothetical protein
MNLRKLIKEQFKSILNEGKYDLISGLIVDSIWKSIKDSREEYDENPEESDVVAYKQHIKFKNLDFDLETIVNRIEQEEFAFNVDGSSDVDSIALKIDINPIYEEQLYNKLNSKLQDTVRHEIEHITQFKGGKSSKPQRPEITPMKIRELIQSNPSRIFEYFLLPEEIPAMVYGMYRQAKTEKRPIDDVFNEYLNYFVNTEKLITPEQKQKIINVWTDYTKKHLPKAVYSKKF